MKRTIYLLAVTMLSGPQSWVLSGGLGVAGRAGRAPAAPGLER
jgi:hypothetical protein